MINIDEIDPYNPKPYTSWERIYDRWDRHFPENLLPLMRDEGVEEAMCYEIVAKFSEWKARAIKATTMLERLTMVEECPHTHHWARLKVDGYDSRWWVSKEWLER